MNVFIGLSANENLNPKYFTLAKEVADHLTNLNYSLVCGATNIGMAKIIADIFREKTSLELIINEKYKHEIIDGYSPYQICKTSFNRAEQIYNKSDLYIIMPGGIGTLSELFGILEECRGMPNKKMIVFNYESYYEDLIKFIKQSIDKGFINEKDFKNLKVVNNIKEFKKEVI